MKPLDFVGLALLLPLTLALILAGVLVGLLYLGLTLVGLVLSIACIPLRQSEFWLALAIASALYLFFR